MENERWETRVFKLPENHGWTAKPGNKVVIADRGALRFEIPEGWVVVPSLKSLKLVDGKPPNDDMSLEVSIVYVGMAGFHVDWSGLPLSELIKSVTSEETTGFSNRNRRSKNRPDRQKTSPPITIKLGDLEMAWAQTEFMDPVEKRPAYSRTALTRHVPSSIHAVLTMSFWPEDAERANDVWNDVLGTMKMGEHFESPFRGPDAK